MTTYANHKGTEFTEATRKFFGTSQEKPLCVLRVLSVSVVGVGDR